MNEPKRIMYRGAPMIEGWPEKIRSAQKLSSYTLKGRSVPRIRYGDEQDDWHADRVACHDCRVIKGEFHVPSCDVEECPACGGQLLSCDCDFDERRDA
jgi:hypothetical protein